MADAEFFDIEIEAAQDVIRRAIEAAGPVRDPSKIWQWRKDVERLAVEITALLDPTASLVKTIGHMTKRDDAHKVFFAPITSLGRYDESSKRWTVELGLKDDGERETVRSGRADEAGGRAQIEALKAAVGSECKFWVHVKPFTSSAGKALKVRELIHFTVIGSSSGTESPQAVPSQSVPPRAPEPVRGSDPSPAPAAAPTQNRAAWLLNQLPNAKAKAQVAAEMRKLGVANVMQPGEHLPAMEALCDKLISGHETALDERADRLHEEIVGSEEPLDEDETMNSLQRHFGAMEPSEMPF